MEQIVQGAKGGITRAPAINNVTVAAAATDTLLQNPHWLKLQGWIGTETGHIKAATRLAHVRALSEIRLYEETRNPNQQAAGVAKEAEQKHLQMCIGVATAV